jgi:hypothetical protein
VGKPGASGARFNGALAPARERFTKHRIQQDARPFCANCKLDLSIPELAPTSSIPPRTSASPASIAGSGAASLRPSAVSHLLLPSRARSAVPHRRALQALLRPRAYQPLRQTPAAPNASLKNLSLLADARAVRKQLKALLAHFRIGFVGKQLDAVVERSDRRHEIVAEPRAKQTGEIDRVHRKALMGQSFNPRKVATH